MWPNPTRRSIRIYTPKKFRLLFLYFIVVFIFFTFTIFCLQLPSSVSGSQLRAFSQFPNSWLQRSIPPFRNSPPFNSMNSPHLHLLISKKTSRFCLPNRYVYVYVCLYKMKLHWIDLTFLRYVQIELGKMLLETGQVHLFENWPDPGVDDDDKKALLAQVILLAARVLNQAINLGRFYMLSFWWPISIDLGIV